MNYDKINLLLLLLLLMLWAEDSVSQQTDCYPLLGHWVSKTYTIVQFGLTNCIRDNIIWTLKQIRHGE